MSNLDHSHLNTLKLLLSNERIRLLNATTEGEKALRRVWVSQLEKEVEGEKVFLGIAGEEDSIENLSDDELLSELLDR